MPRRRCWRAGANSCTPWRPLPPREAAPDVRPRRASRCAAGCAPAGATAGRADPRAGASRAGRRRAPRRGQRRAGAYPPRHHRPRHRRPAALRRRRRAGGQWRGLQLPRAARAARSSIAPPAAIASRRCISGAATASAFAETLRGMYAIALHDRAARQVVLARDPFGIKPLYVAEVEGGIAFASEPQALIAAGLVRPRVRREALAELLQIQFTTGAETIFEGIYARPARRDGGDRRWRRRRAPPPRRAARGRAGERSSAEAALARLRRGVGGERGAAPAQRRALRHVPLGRHRQRRGAGDDGAAERAARSPAFTAGFDVPGAADERAAAAAPPRSGRRAARDGVRSTRPWSGATCRRSSPAMDDPAADYAIIPTWFLARRARGGGEGGALRRGRRRDVRRLRPLPRRDAALVARRQGAALPRLLRPADDVLRAPLTGWRDGTAAAEAAAATPGRTRLQAAQALDVADWLPNDLLIKLDRCLMAHGVEGRMPLLDTGVAAAAFRLPDALKVQGHSGKWLLRQWLARALPRRRALQARSRASPCRSAPGSAAWASGSARWSRRRPGVAEIARPDRVAALFRHAARREAPRLRGVAPAVLRAVAPPACRGAAAGGRCVRGPGGALKRGRPRSDGAVHPAVTRPGCAARVSARPGTVSRGERAHAEASRGERHRPALVVATP